MSLYRPGEWNKFDRRCHGSLYDRGSADSYYGRGIRPHFWRNGDHSDEVIVVEQREVEEYLQGFEDNTEAGNFKDWG